MDDTKTQASNESVPVIRALAKRLDKYRESLRNRRPEAPIFAASNGQPLRLNNILRSCILPALNRCEHCHEEEAGHDEAQAGHEYERDASLPAWHGWHAFRRGLATNLHSLGVDDHTIKAILRHSSVTVTQRSYIKSLPKHSIDAMNTFDNSIAEVVHKRDIDSTGDKKEMLN